ncbi:histidine kinase [Collinsella sp. AGMB00827]|uniref:histidine kinase n=1 Tax=Collinsella ureilytica TaxID=2869515 RepID=A0ABS7ML75_9ACTN|nr:histidine kinase [Collinsella urealyticum]MBY4798123.1 histidine kinase [Collinsella urealyticum]
MSDLPNPIRFPKRLNPTKVLGSAQFVMTVLLGLCVPMLFVLLVWDIVAEVPNPVPAVLTIAGLVLLCFFFSYVFVIPDDLTSSATDRTLAIASKIFMYTRHGLTPETALDTCQIILPETMASAMCITDGHRVLASWGEDSDRCPIGQRVILQNTLEVIESQRVSAFSRDIGSEDRQFFPHLGAGIAAPLIVGGTCMGTMEFYYPRFNNIDMRQTALATGFADLISAQLASFELERQSEASARVELRALQSQVDPHFLFNTIGTIVSLVRTEPEKARSLLIDFSNYYRQTLSDSEQLTSLEHEIEQGVRYINLMRARYGDARLKVRANIDEEAMDRIVPPFILQPLLENCIKHAMRETEPLTIAIEARIMEWGVEITVSDDGIGMSEEVLAHLFDPRSRAVDEPPTVTADGSVKHGCGLALSNVLMRIHLFFGEESGIRVESREGIGTRVTVELVGAPQEPGRSMRQSGA